MSDLPKRLKIPLECMAGAEPIGDAADCQYWGFWCEECRRYRVWPGADWGSSHYFCDDCLAKLELAQ